MSNRQPMLCLRMDIDTIFTPRMEVGMSRFGNGEIEYLPRLIAQAQALECPIHFFALGFGVIDYPDLLRHIINSGFALNSHLHTHRIVLLDDYGLVYEELVTAEHLLRSIGIEPSGLGATGCYAEGINGKEDVQELLLKRGYGWVSSQFNLQMTLAQLQPYRYPSGLLELPLAGWSDITFLYSHDQFAVLPEYQPQEHTWPAFISHIQEMIDLAARENFVYSMVTHPALLAKHDPELTLLTILVQHARKANVKLVNFHTIAEVFHD